MPASGSSLKSTVGLCTEFGPRIQPGCDHPMVAEGNACACPSCGAVCTGRFNGCAQVWARGPVQLALRSGSETHIVTNGTSPPTDAGNGAKASDQRRPASVDVASVAVVRSDEIQVLLAEVRVLAERVEEATLNRSPGVAAEGLGPAANTMLIRLETLPERIADAITNALANQHRMIMRDVHATLEEFGQRLECRLGELRQRSDQADV
jgi:hypothetical protein